MARHRVPRIIVLTLTPCAHRNVFRPFHSSLSVEGHRFFYSPLNGRGSPLYTWAVFFTLTHRLYQPMCKRSTAALGCGFIRLVYLPTSYTLAGVLPAPAFRLSNETCICAPVGVEPTPNTFWCRLSVGASHAIPPLRAFPLTACLSVHYVPYMIFYRCHAAPHGAFAIPFHAVPLRLMSVLCHSIVTLCISTAVPHVTFASQTETIQSHCTAASLITLPSHCLT